MIKIAQSNNGAKQQPTVADPSQQQHQQLLYYDHIGSAQEAGAYVPSGHSTEEHSMYSSFQNQESHFKVG